MIRLLVAGGGLIGSRHIAQAFAHPQIDLVGVIDPDPKVQQAAPVAAFSAIQDVDVPADGIILATPSDLHAEHAEQAAERGWHMLIEKPVASTLEQADRIIAAADQAGVRTLVGHHRRHHPRVQKLRQIVQSGDIGTPVVVSLIWAMKKPDPYFDVPWRKGRDGSPIMINLVHEVDLLRFLFGEICHVSGFGSSQIRDQERVESGGVTVGFETGCVATLAFADTTPSPWSFEAGTGENPNIGTTHQDALHIAGTQGAVSFPSLTVWGGAADWSQAATPTRTECAEGVPLDIQLGHFADVIAGTAQPLIDAADGRRTLSATVQIEQILSGGATP